MLSTTRFNAIHAGLTSVAQKVYEAVPIAEAWSQSQIYAELSRKQISANHRVMVGCLDNLVSQGLIAEPSRGMFRRVAIRPAKVAPTPAPAPDTPPQQEEPMKPALAPAPAPVAAPTISPIDRLGLLASRVAAISAELATLATDISNATVEAQMQMEANAEDTQKLRQLQAILKG